MSFPIFQPHREMTMSEIYRYLKFFSHHSVYMTARKGFLPETEIEVETTHTFATHGLVITLFWRGNRPNDIRSCHLAAKELFKRHRSGQLSLLRYEITEYSNVNSLQPGVPSEECQSIFYNHILDTKNRPFLSVENYYDLEYNCTSLNEIPDALFEAQIEEQKKRSAFDAYYASYKERQREESIQSSSPNPDKSTNKKTS